MTTPVARPGEAIRQAVRWIGQARRDRPGVPLVELVDEASRQFDLGPLDQEFLWRALRNPLADDAD
ncbi:MAG: hypothetical protein HY904_13415 [Deltaproteobacteria bacterium]|nr:hypothetical protein [Deltaproteobacteria bacterium]